MVVIAILEANLKYRLVVRTSTVCGREQVSELSRFIYNKGHPKSRETTREFWRSEGEVYIGLV